MVRTGVDIGEGSLADTEATGAVAGWLTPGRYYSGMHRYESSRPAATASERKRAVAETARRLRGLPPTPSTLVVYRQHLKDISAWLGGQPLSEHTLARYIRWLDESGRRTAVPGVVSAVHHFFYGAGRPLPLGRLNRRAVLACAAADALRCRTTGPVRASDITDTPSCAPGAAPSHDAASRRPGITAAESEAPLTRSPKRVGRQGVRTSEDVVTSLFVERSMSTPRRPWTAEEDGELAAIAAENRVHGIRNPGTDRFTSRLKQFADEHDRTYAAVQKRAQRIGAKSYCTARDR